MESIVLIASLVTVVSAYLLRQFWVHALEVDDAPTGDLAPPDTRDAGDLKAA